MSIADEIAKLDDLRVRGVITEDEFEQQKRSILDGSNTTMGPKPAAFEIIPLVQRWWFQALLLLIAFPVGLAVLVFVPAYRREKGQFSRIGKGWKSLCILFVLLLWGLVLTSLSPNSSHTKEGVPFCNSREVEKALKDAIEHGPASRLVNLRLLDLSQIKEVSYDSTKQERHCQGLASLNSGQEEINYRLWPGSKDGTFLVEIAPSRRQRFPFRQ